MILIALQSCQCFLRKNLHGVLRAYFSVKQMHMPEDRVAFIKGDISVGGIEQREMQEALMVFENPPSHRTLTLHKMHLPISCQMISEPLQPNPAYNMTKSQSLYPSYV